MLVTAGTAVVLALFVNNSQAQTAAAPAPPATAPAPPPGLQPRPFSRARQPEPVLSRAISDLRMAKMQLQRSTNDFDGHKASAIQACDKAMEELQAIVKASVAAQQRLQPPPAGQAPGQPSAPPQPAVAPAPPPPAPAPPGQP